MLGMLRVDENLYPIVRIELIPGGITFHARVRGPMDAAAGPIRVFTTSGVAVTDRFTGVSKVNIPRIFKNDSLELSYTWELNSLNQPPYHGKVTYKDKRK